MGINLGTGFGNLNGNTNNTKQTSGMILNLNKQGRVKNMDDIIFEKVWEDEVMFEINIKV